MTKVIEVKQAGYTWHIPLRQIAKHRAEYYLNKHSDETTYDEEVQHVMEDDFEGVDWFQNNMNLSDLPCPPRITKTPDNVGVLDITEDYEIEIKETEVG